MKLIYMWIENYNNRIVNQEFSFSPEFSVHYDFELNNLTVRRNDEYIKDFYGSNILDITAVVGENAAGKTTLMKCIYEMCHSVDPVDDEVDEIKCGKIIVYKEEKNTDKEEGLIILYYSKNKIMFKIEEVKYELINLYDMSPGYFTQSLEKHKMSTVFFTNAFDISHVLTNQGLGEYSEGGIKKSMCFSPALMLKRESRYIKNGYGAQSIESGMILDIIQQYAEKMGVDIEEAYVSAFTYNFLITVRYMPNAIAALLPVFSKFNLSVVPFGEYILNQRSFVKMSEYDKSICFIRKNIYENIIIKLSKNNWEKIYVNFLCEIVMFLNVFNGDYKHVDFMEIEKEHYNINSIGAFELIMNQVEDSEKKDLIYRIRNIEKVDIKILDDFLNVIKNIEPELSKSKWCKQVEYFRTIYEKEYQYMKIPNQIDCGYSEFIEVLLNEHYNDESFWNRMIKIIPNPISSGEGAIINIFSSIYKIISRKTEGNILLLLDEIDAFLHPRWQQNILTHIVRWINEGEKFKVKKVQIIMASHSPIILSDIPRDRIIYLNNLCKVTLKDNLTFGANINKLFYDSFFMDEGSIGAFAKYKIEGAIDDIKKGENSPLKNETEYIINNIGEPYVRQKLLRDLKYSQLKRELNDKD